MSQFNKTMLVHVFCPILYVLEFSTKTQADYQTILTSVKIFVSITKKFYHYLKQFLNSLKKF